MGNKRLPVMNVLTTLWVIAGVCVLALSTKRDWLDITLAGSLSAWIILRSVETHYLRQVADGVEELSELEGW